MRFQNKNACLNLLSEKDDGRIKIWRAKHRMEYGTFVRQNCFGREHGRMYRLAISNLEIREWFWDASAGDLPKLDRLCEAFPAKDAQTVEQLFNDYLWHTISIRDVAAKKEKKENFNHGILLGLLGHKENWLVRLNAESGEGYSDILVEVPESRTGVVIELKYAENGRLDAACGEALRQIEAKQYASKLENDGMQMIVKFGIACYKKRCRVVVG